MKLSIKYCGYISYGSRARISHGSLLIVDNPDLSFSLCDTLSPLDIILFVTYWLDKIKLSMKFCVHCGQEIKKKIAARRVVLLCDVFLL